MLYSPKPRAKLARQEYLDTPKSFDIFEPVVDMAEMLEIISVSEITDNLLEGMYPKDLTAREIVEGKRHWHQ